MYTVDSLWFPPYLVVVVIVGGVLLPRPDHVRQCRPQLRGNAAAAAVVPDDGAVGVDVVQETERN